jgi:anti-anti-sigma factor
VNILQETHGQVLMIAPSGRLDSETSGELELVLHDAGNAGRRHFVIDLAAVTYVSSAGLRVLLALAKRLDGGVGSVRLCGLSASVRQVFDIAGFTSMFALFPNRHGGRAAPAQTRHLGDAARHRRTTARRRRNRHPPMTMSSAAKRLPSCRPRPARRNCRNVRPWWGRP